MLSMMCWLHKANHSSPSENCLGIKHIFSPFSVLCQAKKEQSLKTSFLRARIVVSSLFAKLSSYWLFGP